MTVKIFKGFHFSFPPIFWIYFGRKEWRWKVHFDSSWIYDIGAKQTQINKLIGFRRNIFSNHKNSARFGARWNKSSQELELMAYCYDNGVRLSSAATEVIVASVPINNDYEVAIQEFSSSYVFSVYDVHGKLISVKTVSKSFKGGYFSFRSNPYFGGQGKGSTAPHTIKTKIY